jgi:hypothetical protein
MYVMTRGNDELERPVEWLRRFAEDAGAYRELLDEAGSLAVAAYRLARARCRAHALPSNVPTLSELRSAADDVALHAGLEPHQHLGVLVADCALAGLPVILPPSFDSAA